MSEKEFSFYMEITGEIMRFLKYLSVIPGLFIFVDLKSARRDIRKWIFTALMSAAMGSGLFRISYLALTGLYSLVSDHIVDSMEIVDETSLEVLYIRLLALWIITCVCYVVLTAVMFLIIKKTVKRRYAVSLFEAVYLSIITLTAEVLARFFVKIAVVPVEGGVFVLNEEIKASPWMFLALSVLLFAGEASLVASWQKNRQYMEHERVAIAERIQAESLKRRLEEVQESTERLRSFRHDLRNHISVLHGLLNEGAAEEAEAYLQRMEKNAGVYEKRYDTGIILLDVILNDKAAVSDRLGIVFTAFVEIKRLPDVMQYDAAVLLGNLADNAIHGAAMQNNDTPFVSVRISERNGFLFMEIKNSFHGRLEIDPGVCLPVADTNDEDGHGLGIPNSLAICERYYGTLVFSQDGNSVTVDAMMQYPDHS